MTQAFNLSQFANNVNSAGVAQTGGGGTGTNIASNDLTVNGLTVGKGGGAVGTNTAIGATALNGNTSGANNTAVGYQAGYSNTTANSTTVMGYQAARTNSTTGGISAFGYQALYSMNGAANNSAFGYQSLYATTTGNDNIGVGVYSLTSNTTGAYNTGLGVQSLNSNTTASNNTAVGYQAGYAQTGGSNTLIGYRAGYAITSGDSNSFLGINSGNAITTGRANVIMGGYSGNNGGLDIRTASNYIVLSDGDGNPRLLSDNGGNIIINTNAYNSARFCVNQTTTSERGVAVLTPTSYGSAAFRSVSQATQSNSWYHFYGSSNADTVVNCIIYGNGNIQNANNSYGSLSDIKLKENIVDASPKLEDLCKVKVRNYNLKSDPNHKQIGVIAQELEEVFSGLVEETPDRGENDEMLETTTKTVKYSVFVPMLIKAVQELNEKVEAQALEIATLKAK